MLRLLIAFFLLGTAFAPTANAQITPYSRPAEQPIVPVPIDQIRNAATRVQARSDQNAEILDSLMTVVFDLKYTGDQELTQDLTDIERQIRVLGDAGGLAYKDKEIREIKWQLLEVIARFKARQKQQ